MGGLWGLSDVLMHFFLFFLASAAAAGPLDKLIHASIIDLGTAEGSEGIASFSRGVGVWDRC